MKKAVLFMISILISLVVLFFLLKTPMARKNNEKGLQYFASSEFDKAQKYFTKTIVWKRNYREGWINLVKCQLEQQQIDRAQMSLSRLIGIAPDRAETLGLEGQLLVIRKDFQAALEKLNQSIARDSLLAYTYFYRGMANANLGRLEAAAADYLKAQDLDHENTEALEKRGIILSRLNNFEAAISNYDRLLELDPSNTMAFFNRGSFKMQIGNYAGAIEDFSQAITLDKAMSEAFYNRGKSFAALENYAEAILDFNRSAELNYKIAGANYNAGLASLKLNDLKGAKKCLLTCISTDKQNEHTGKAYHLLGVLEMMQNNNSASISYFNRSIELDSAFPDAYYNRGIAYGMMKEYNKAINDLNTCISLGNSSPDVYFARGVNKISLSDYAGGCADLTKAEKSGHQQAISMRKQYCKQYP